jgi:hypothetical protein
MKDPIATPHSLSEMTPKARRAFVAFGLWLRLGIIGAFGLAAGVLQLFNGEVKPLSALALAIGGGIFLAIGVWRGHAALENVDPGVAVTSGASSAASTTQVGPASRPASRQAPRRALIDALRRVAGIRPEVSS